MNKIVENLRNLQPSDVGNEAAACEIERLTAEVASLKEQLAAREARIQSMRSDIQSVLCDHDGEPCFHGSPGDRRIISDLLEARDDTPFLHEHEARLLEEMARRINDEGSRALPITFLRNEAATRRPK